MSLLFQAGRRIAFIETFSGGVFISPSRVFHAERHVSQYLRNGEYRLLRRRRLGLQAVLAASLSSLWRIRSYPFRKPAQCF